MLAFHVTSRIRISAEIYGQCDSEEVYANTSILDSKRWNINVQN